ncbi:MAG TPA: cytidylate kinase-like family protein [Gemmatimonadaceae bacterium]|jgi:cytidylate kinase|nr:cytidylate kinase-like family protein [Gemmatimonadaceae bacterium]
MPIITVSRMYGSGGSELAARVAARLGWLLLDNALVEEVAARLGTTPAEVEAREERVSSLAERLARALMFGSPETTTALPEALLQPTEEQILQVTQRVIDETVARGPVVLVGRGAQCALAQRTDALHVFCYAPLPALVERARQRLGVTSDEARRAVEQTNRDRVLYVRKHWHREWLDHTNYHLCVNTGWLGVEGAADAVLYVAETLYGWHAGSSEETGDSG